jgi:hypothetical protein
MFGHLTPTLFVIGYTAVALLVYFQRNLLAFRSHRRFLGVDESQKNRFTRFADDVERIIQLQIDTNNLHESAISAKTQYEAFGVAACSGAPALICLAAMEPILQHAHMSSALGLAIAHAFVACAVLLIIWTWRHPSKPHVDARLRAEVLRLHLHCLLAGVGPYASAPPTRTLSRADVNKLDLDGVVDELRKCERECQEQSEQGSKITSFPEYDKSHAEVYLLERIGEQKDYFLFAAERHRRAYDRSAWGVFMLVAVAAVAGIGNVFVVDPPISEWFGGIFLVSGSTVLLLVSLRAVFGWDSKAALYVRQQDLLRKLIGDRDIPGDLYKQIEAITPGMPAAGKFRQTAAQFEALMAREACDWRLISDREVYDITF